MLYWYKALAQILDVPLFVLDTPFNYGGATNATAAAARFDPSQEDYICQQLHLLSEQLQRFLGVRLSQGRLQRALDLSLQTARVWRQVLATMQQRPAPMTVFDAFVHMAPVVSLRGLPVALEYYRELLKELEQRLEQGIGAIAREEKRLLWDNIAIWFELRPLAQWFAERNMAFVAATYTNAWAETIDHLDPAQPFPSLAKAYGRVILNNHLQHRCRLMERMVRDYQIDGVVIHSARSCKPYSVGQYGVRRVLQQRLGIPCTIIDGDIVDPRAYAREQTLARLQAFCELLEQP